MSGLAELMAVKLSPAVREPLAGGPCEPLAVRLWPVLM